MLDWTSNDVEEWAGDFPVLKPHAHVLQAQQVTGRALLTLTEAKLMQDGFPRGPAAELMLEIEKLKNLQQQPGACVSAVRSSALCLGTFLAGERPLDVFVSLTFL